jgi:hypothetical protein
VKETKFFDQCLDNRDNHCRMGGGCHGPLSLSGKIHPGCPRLQSRSSFMNLSADSKEMAELKLSLRKAA